MLNGSNETLSKIAEWDLEENPKEDSNINPVEKAVYKQLQAYFMDAYVYLENLSRISRQLNIIVADFKSGWPIILGHRIFHNCRGSTV